MRQFMPNYVHGNCEAIEKVVTIFRELRLGQTLDGKNKVKKGDPVTAGHQIAEKIIHALH